MTYQYSYKELLARAERINWRVEDLIGGDKTLDFSKPFLPEGLARTDQLSFLNADERLVLNQVRGHAYLSIFGLVEEFILPFVLDHARSVVHGDEYRERALLEFAGEEAKHIHLFRCFRQEFVAGFGVQCDIIGPPEAVASHVLSHAPLSVALLTLHIEWMVQRHFQESIQENTALDPQFKSLLLHHWMEELQHAELDAMMVAAIAEKLTPEEIEAGVQGYVALGGFLDDGLKQQTLFDLEAFERATGRSLGDVERALFVEVQHQANRWTYIGSGMTHPRFLESLGRISPNGRAMIEGAAPTYS
ncbi:MAG: hypothetical protein NT015_07205 [Alphaproteobacteria bacterium]|nr:hypothetical protein [Alphaproteobacteria bacterium]